MDNRDYSGNSAHEVELRRRYDEIFKVIGEKVGFTNFSYEKYKNDMLPTHQKAKFEEELEKEITNPQDDKIKTALGVINNSFIVGQNRDKITDMKTFEAFGEKTVKKAPIVAPAQTASPVNSQGATDNGAEEQEEEPDEYDEELGADSNTKKIFPGYDKKVPFFAAIKKAYKERKDKTNSRILAILSGLRAGLCRVGPIVGIVIAVLGIVVPGFQFFSTKNIIFAYRALKYLGFIAGGNALGAIWQKIEDGKIEHGIVGKIKKLFKGKEDTDQEKLEKALFEPQLDSAKQEEQSLPEPAKTKGQTFPAPVAEAKQTFPVPTAGEPAKKSSPTVSQPEKEDDDADYMYYGSLPTYFKEDDEGDYFNYGNAPYKPARKIEEAETYQLYNGGYSDFTAPKKEEGLKNNQPKDGDENASKGNDTPNVARQIITKEDELQATIDSNKHKKDLISSLKNIQKRLNSAKETSLRYNETIIEMLKSLDMSNEEALAILNRAGLDSEEIEKIIEQVTFLNAEKGENRGK